MTLGTGRHPPQAVDELQAEPGRIGELRLVMGEHLDPSRPLVFAIVLEQHAGGQIRARVQGFNQFGKQFCTGDVRGAYCLDIDGLGRERRLVEQHPHCASHGGFRAPPALCVCAYPAAELAVSTR